MYLSPTYHSKEHEPHLWTNLLKTTWKCIQCGHSGNPTRTDQLEEYNYGDYDDDNNNNRQICNTTFMFIQEI